MSSMPPVHTIYGGAMRSLGNVTDLGITLSTTLNLYLPVFKSELFSMINACRLIISRATENALSKEMRGEGGAMETRLHTSIASLQTLVGRVQVRLMPVPMTDTGRLIV